MCGIFSQVLIYACIQRGKGYRGHFSQPQACSKSKRTHLKITTQCCAPLFEGIKLMWGQNTADLFTGYYIFIYSVFLVYFHVRYVAGRQVYIQCTRDSMSKWPLNVVLRQKIKKANSWKQKKISLINVYSHSFSRRTWLC